MELDDLKSIWAEGPKESNNKPLTSKIIDEMTRRKYYAKVKRIVYPEIIGVVVCLLALLFIAKNFYQYDTALLQVTAILSMVTLLLVSALSVFSIYPITELKDVNKPFAETIRSFAHQKIRFYKLQKLNVTLSYVLLVTFIVLLSKLSGGVDITGNKLFWICSFTFGYLFLLFYSKWVMKYYRKSLSQAEELLQELPI